MYRAIYQYVTPIIKMWDCKLKHIWQTDDTYNKEFVLFPFLFSTSTIFKYYIKQPTTNIALGSVNKAIQLHTNILVNVKYFI